MQLFHVLLKLALGVFLLFDTTNLLSQEFPVDAEVNLKSRVELKEWATNVHVEKIADTLITHLWSGAGEYELRPDVVHLATNVYHLDTDNYSVTKLRVDENTLPFKGTTNFNFTERIMNYSESKRLVNAEYKMMEICVIPKKNKRNNVIIQNINGTFVRCTEHCSLYDYSEYDGKFNLVAVFNSNVKIFWIDQEGNKEEIEFEYDYTFDETNRIISAYVIPGSGPDKGKVLMLKSYEPKGEPSELRMIELNYGSQSNIATQKEYRITTDEKFDKNTQFEKSRIYGATYKDDALNSFMVSYATTSFYNTTGGTAGMVIYLHPISNFRKVGNSYVQISELMYSISINQIKYFDHFKNGYICISAGIVVPTKSKNLDLSSLSPNDQQMASIEGGFYPHIQIAYIDENLEIFYKILPSPYPEFDFGLFRTNEGTQAEELQFVIVIGKKKRNRIRELSIGELVVG